MGSPLENARAIGARTAAAALVWWVLSEGRSDGWMVGGVAIAVAVTASLWLVPAGAGARGWPRAAVGFVGFFLLQSLRAGLQVAWLALAPGARIAPGSVDVTLALPPGPPQFLLAGTLSLLPGTLSVKLDGSRLVVHALTGLAHVPADVRALEARIAPLFGVTT